MRKLLFVVMALLVASVWPATARAHFAGFKSPGPGMHFTQGQPIVVFADLFDDRENKGIIVCPAGQTISNTSPPPDYSDPPRPAQCSGGGTPTGWPGYQVLIDGVLQTDIASGSTTLPNTTAFDHNINADPIDFFRFSASSVGLAPGPHQIVARGLFSADAVKVTTQDSPPMTIYVDAPPTGKTTVTLTANLSGTVNWNNVIVVGNGFTVKASGSLVIRDSLVTGLGALATAGLTGTVSDADIEGSIFEDTGAIDLTLGNGAVVIKNNEFRANNRLTFVASDPAVPFMLTLGSSGSDAKSFQGNRIGAGQVSFGGSNWLIGGDTDAESNILIGPRAVLNVAGSNIVVRGNFGHHNYRGGWSQGFNFYYARAGAGVLTEHNFIRDSSWPVQDLAGEFRYNVVFGYGHNWVRSTASGASIHHNVFAPDGDGGLNSGIQCYGGESGLSIYNNTFDGGGAAIGDFAGPTIDMSGGSQVSSFRNNLLTYSRNQNNDSPGDARVTGGSAAYAYADYNAFYSPDNDNKTSYDWSGAGAHDVSGAGALGVTNGQLAASPFAGSRLGVDVDGTLESVIDEAAVWQGTQKVSQVLAIFRARYAPKAGSPIINAGDLQDNDSQGRRTDIGAVDLDGHDQDKLGKFGTPPSETVPPTVTLTAPTTGATLSALSNLAATATDNAGGSGVVLVQFLVDGRTVGQTAANPYALLFNTAILSNGDHTFAAKAWDAAGNFGVSAAITAKVANAATAPDAGARDTSSGAPDASVGTPDASAGNPDAINVADAGTSPADVPPTGGGSDAGTTTRTAGSGCGCTLARPRRASQPLLLLLLGLLWVRHRR